MANPDVFYIGSTTQPLPKRSYEHKRKYKSYLNGKYAYVSSFKILETDPNPRIELIEACPCDSRMELHRTEGKFIREMDCVNKRVAGRTKAEYREDNKEKLKAYKKQYHKTNREAILVKQKQYHKDNKEKLNAYSKQYHEDNKEKIKQYREDNKEKIKAYGKQYRSIKVVCECGSTISRAGLTRHKKSNKHKQLMADK